MNERPQVLGGPPPYTGIGRVDVQPGRGDQEPMETDDLQACLPRHASDSLALSGVQLLHRGPEREWRQLNAFVPRFRHELTDSLPAPIPECLVTNRELRH